MNKLQKTIKLRAQLKQHIRNFFDKRDYVEVDTPIVTICPGTEVHLNYFETKWRDYKGADHQRFLRSSPELHMKRLIANGLPKVFQMAPCFRNHGELSEWHNPEFTMLEWYQSQLSYFGLIDETEDLLRTTADGMASITNIKPEAILPKQFTRMSVFEAFKHCANIDLIDLDPDLARKAKFAGIISCREDDDFETSYFKILIEKIEPYIASHHGFVLMDYPPSQAALSVVDNGKACRFEYYLGRVELCNGFFELTGEQNNRERIKEALDLRVKLGNSFIPEDEDFYQDMKKFNSPCSGNALGFDRWLALLSGERDLNQAIAFR